MRTLALSKPFMSGNDVEAWQKFLLSWGIDVGLSGPDGVFGSDTAAATTEFETKVGITPPTGIVAGDCLEAAKQNGFEPVEYTPEEVSPKTTVLVETVGGVSVFMDGAVGRFVSELTIDADGAYRAYHPKDRGLDALANAGKPGNWWALATNNGTSKGTPVVQGVGDPAPGYYVSKTSLENKDFDPRDPRRYVDSESVPYFVLPPQVSKALGMKLGDLGTLVNIEKRFVCHAIFADVGPKHHLGEASIKAAQLLGVNANPRIGGTNKRIIAYICYPGSGNGKPQSNDTIMQEAIKRFNEYGKIEKVLTLSAS